MKELRQHLQGCIDSANLALKVLDLEVNIDYSEGYPKITISDIPVKSLVCGGIGSMASIVGAIMELRSQQNPISIISQIQQEYPRDTPAFNFFDKKPRRRGQRRSNYDY